MCFRIGQNYVFTQGRGTKSNNTKRKSSFAWRGPGASELGRPMSSRAGRGPQPAATDEENAKQRVFGHMGNSAAAARRAKATRAGGEKVVAGRTMPSPTSGDNSAARRRTPPPT